jgi:hypothetical protein
MAYGRGWPRHNLQFYASEVPRRRIQWESHGSLRKLSRFSPHSRQARSRSRGEILSVRPDARLICVRDMHYIVTCRNRGREESCGWTRKELIGNRSDDLLRIVFPKPVEGIRVKIVRHQSHQRIALAFPAGLLASLLTPRAKAQSQPPQYVATVWQTEQRLPQNSVYGEDRNDKKDT